MFAVWPREDVLFTSWANQEPNAEEIDVIRKNDFLKWLLQGEKS